MSKISNTLHLVIKRVSRGCKNIHRSDRKYWFYSRSYNFLILYHRFKRYFIIPSRIVFLFRLLIYYFRNKTSVHGQITTYQFIYKMFDNKRRKDRAFKSFLSSDKKHIILKFTLHFLNIQFFILILIQHHHFFRSNPHQSQQTNSLSISTLLVSHTHTHTHICTHLYSHNTHPYPIFTWTVLATR